LHPQDFAQDTAFFSLRQDRERRCGEIFSARIPMQSHICATIAESQRNQFALTKNHEAVAHSIVKIHIHMPEGNALNKR